MTTSRAANGENLVILKFQFQGLSCVWFQQITREHCLGWGELSYHEKELERQTERTNLTENSLAASLDSVFRGFGGRRMRVGYLEV